MENFEIIVDDGKVFVKEFTISKSMSLTDFAKRLVTAEKNIETPMLPPNCVKFKSDGKKNEYFIHIPMGTYQLKYRGKTYLTTMPHQIIYFRFTNTNPKSSSLDIAKLFWNFDRELDFTKKSFQKPALQNIHDSMSFCMGHIASASTQIGLINNYVKSFFENEFNNDLSSGKRLISEVSKEQERLFKADSEDNDFSLAKLWLSGRNMRFTEKFTINEILRRN